MTFHQKLQACQLQNRSAVGLPLNVRMDKLPLPMARLDNPMFPFARSIIDATQDLVCAYSIDPAYYLSEAAAGMIALERVTRYIPDHIPIIFDAKFGELGDNADRYAVTAFEAFHSDAVTFSVIPDELTIDAFVKQPGKTVFFPGADLQAAIEICGARSNGGCGISVRIEQLSALAKLEAGIPIIISLGRSSTASSRAIEGNARETRASSLSNEIDTGPIRDFRKSHPLSIVEMSSSIIYESRREDYAEVVREAVLTSKDRIRT